MIKEIEDQYDEYIEDNYSWLDIAFHPRFSNRQDPFDLYYYDELERYDDFEDWFDSPSYLNSNLIYTDIYSNENGDLFFEIGHSDDEKGFFRFSYNIPTHHLSFVSFLNLSYIYKNIKISLECRCIARNDFFDTNVFKDNDGWWKIISYKNDPIVESLPTSNHVSKKYIIGNTSIITKYKINNCTITDENLPIFFANKILNNKEINKSTLMQAMLFDRNYGLLIKSLYDKFKHSQ